MEHGVSGVTKVAVVVEHSLVTRGGVTGSPVTRVGGRVGGHGGTGDESMEKTSP